MEDVTFGLGVSQDENTPEVAPVQVKEIVRSQTDFSQQPRYDIRIEMSEGDPAKDWKCGINGSVFQIWRGTVVSVPECVIGVLRTSVGARLIQIPQPDGPPRNEWQEASQVNYSIIRGPY